MRPNDTSPEAVAERFWSLVQPEPNTGCWLWMGGCDGNHRGWFCIGRGVSVRTSRMAYELARGPIPPGLFILHSCIGMPNCVNPAHLRPGTHQENMADRRAQRREAWGDRNGSRLHPERLPRGDASSSRRFPATRPRGERNGTAKLTEALVRELRALYAAGGISQKALARRFGVVKTQVRNIIHGRCWAHVGESCPKRAQP